MSVEMIDSLERHIRYEERGYHGNFFFFQFSKRKRVPGIPSSETGERVDEHFTPPRSRNPPFPPESKASCRRAEYFITDHITVT